MSAATGNLGWAVQKATYAALLADAGVKAVLGDPARIYDDSPRRPTYPFATFGEWRVGALSGVDGTFEHDIRLRIFSRYQGRKETRDAMAAVYDALQDAALTPENRTLVSMRFVFSDVFLRADGRTWNGVMRFRAVDAPGV
ncbi:MAG: DUF3168 domain-containing protein [Pseudomonadota bacterium]